MAILTIKNCEAIINRFEVENIKVAKKYVASDKVANGQVAVYSTFNKNGVENTINILKQ